MLVANLTADPKQPAGPGTPPSALPAVTAEAPPLAAQHTRECTTVLQKLPIRLEGLVQRVVHPSPDTPFVVAWGEPPVVWSCGVVRPAQLAPGSAALIITVDGVNFLPVPGKDETTWTAIDRAVYLQVVVPSTYRQPPLGPIAQAIGALPAVCVVDSSADTSTQCTRRK